MSTETTSRPRAALFRYAGLAVHDATLVATYDVDGHLFTERLELEGVRTLDAPGVVAVAELWYLLAGLSYYKTGAARRIDVGSLPLGDHGGALLRAAVIEGLGEFAFRNNLDLDEVDIVGGAEVAPRDVDVDPRRILVPFGGGIDSVVTTALLADDLDAALFIQSPASGPFAPLEATARVTGLDVVRATRSLDPQLRDPDDTFFHGHVPVTAMVTLAAALGALASGRGGVAMSNEHSASVANLVVGSRAINHQWSKSFDAELLLSAAIGERVGDGFCVASTLRDRSELWVAQVFSELTAYHHVFRSCNRAFTQDPDRRFTTWCGECDKCLFINLMLAPFLPRDALRSIFHHEPLADPARLEQLRVLVGAGVTYKPFECVGDPSECASALARVAALDEWRDVTALADLAATAPAAPPFDALLLPEGPRRVPAHWLQ